MADSESYDTFHQDTSSDSERLVINLPDDDDDDDGNVYDEPTENETFGQPQGISTPIKSDRIHVTWSPDSFQNPPNQFQGDDNIQSGEESSNKSTELNQDFNVSPIPRSVSLKKSVPVNDPCQNLPPSLLNKSSLSHEFSDEPLPVITSHMLFDCTSNDYSSTEIKTEMNKALCSSWDYPEYNYIMTGLEELKEKARVSQCGESHVRNAIKPRTDIVHNNAESEVTIKNIYMNTPAEEDVDYQKFKSQLSYQYKSQQTQQRHAHVEKKGTSYPKPPYTYAAMCIMAIQNSEDKALTFSEITDALKLMFPDSFSGEYQGWQKCVQQMLYTTNCFVRHPELHGKRSYSKWRVNLSTVKPEQFRRQSVTLDRNLTKREYQLFLHDELNIPPIMLSERHDDSGTTETPLDNTTAAAKIPHKHLTDTLDIKYVDKPPLVLEELHFDDNEPRKKATKQEDKLLFEKLFKSEPIQAHNIKEEINIIYNGRNDIKNTAAQDYQTVLGCFDTKDVKTSTVLQLYCDKRSQHSVTQDENEVLPSSKSLTHSLNSVSTIVADSDDFLGARVNLDKVGPREPLSGFQDNSVNISKEEDLKEIVPRNFSLDSPVTSPIPLDVFRDGEGLDRVCPSADLSSSSRSSVISSTDVLVTETTSGSNKRKRKRENARSDSNKRACAINASPKKCQKESTTVYPKYQGRNLVPYGYSNGTFSQGLSSVARPYSTVSVIPPHLFPCHPAGLPSMHFDRRVNPNYWSPLHKQATNYRSIENMKLPFGYANEWFPWQQSTYQLQSCVPYGFQSLPYGNDAGYQQPRHETPRWCAPPCDDPIDLSTNSTYL